ncbi:MAG: hypothetical protein CMM92_00085 [Rickettsiales bacterium]|nr:hypothetical protein [Rickettsiales bacterium]RPG16316.1 MAG: glycosyltransferase family 1 protein [Pelagibacteraceae bacterium TMED195]
MKKYKLLYFVSEDEYFLSHKIFQAKDALKNKFDVMIICNFTKHENKIRSEGFRTQNINFNRKSINPFNNLIYLLRLLKIIYTFKPDLIQCFALKPILITSIAAFFNKKVKVLCCVVGVGFLIINKNFFSNLIRGCYFFLLKTFSIRNITYIFQNLDDLKLFEEKGVIKNKNVKIIKGSGVDTNFFKKGHQKKIYDLIFHSRILKDKGIFEIINALKKLQKKKIILRTLILGNPDPKNFSSISLKKLNEWNDNNIIIWKPRVLNVLPYLQKARIAILPSYREGLPRSLIEAASCELPIISTNVPGCKEICIDKFNGYLVKPKDSTSLAEAIEKLIFNQRLIDKFGKNGRDHVVKNFENKLVSKKFSELYESLLE